MDAAVEIRLLASEHHDSVARIADSLPEWFTEGGRAAIRADLTFRRGLVAVDAAGRCVGFLLFQVAEGGGRIEWMGVDRSLHRRGVGRSLIREAERRMSREGAAFVEVSTLGDAVDYPPYAETRAFYRGLGFVTHRREVHDNPECPESVVLRKALRGS